MERWNAEYVGEWYAVRFRAGVRGCGEGSSKPPGDC